jgi:hypothetical protein
MNNHTPEPWIFENRNGDHKHADPSGWGRTGFWRKGTSDFILGSDTGWEGGFIVEDEYAPGRILKCVNACAGMEDPAAEIDQLRAENAVLRDALEEILERRDKNMSHALDVAREALDKTKEAE